MNKKLKELCREVSELIRNNYHFTTKITIDGNYGYEVETRERGILLNPEENAIVKMSGELRRGRSYGKDKQSGDSN